MGSAFFKPKREDLKTLDSPFTPDHTLVYVLVGSSGAALTEKFTTLEPQSAQTSTPPAGAHMRPITLNMQGQHIRLELWSIPNDPQHRAIRETYLPLAHAVFICPDLTKPNAQEEIETLARTAKNLSQQPQIFLVGTQPSAQLQALAEKHQITFMTANASTGENVDKLFIDTTEQILEKVSYHPSL